MIKTGHKVKRICAGEYEYKGFDISKCDSNDGTWWVRNSDKGIREDTQSFKGAKDLIDNISKKV